MKTSAALLAAAFVVAAPAHSAVVYSNDFNSENGGNTALHYNSFNGLGSIGGGDVDLVKSGDYSIDCVGGSGACVDLDGTPGPGKLTSLSTYAFNAGDTITLNFAYSGNQRGGPDDDIEAKIFWAGALPVTALGYTIDGEIHYLAPGVGTGAYLYWNDIGSELAFRQISFFATMGAAGSVGFSFATNSGDNIGPILDNVSLDISAVPEPASWAMMIGGLALVGGAMRRRRMAVSFA